MLPIPPWVYAAGAFATFAAGGLAGWTVRDWKADSDELAARDKALAREDKARERVAAQAEGYEARKGAELPITNQGQETIRVIYKDRVVNPGCALDPAAGSVLDATIARANARAAGEPQGEVPTDQPAP